MAVHDDVEVDLLALSKARDSVTRAEYRLARAVTEARARGRSWGFIGMQLGVPAAEAQARFARFKRAGALPPR